MESRGAGGHVQGRVLSHHRDRVCPCPPSNGHCWAWFAVRLTRREVQVGQQADLKAHHTGNDWQGQ